MGLIARWISPTHLAVRAIRVEADDRPDVEAPADVVVASPAFAADGAWGGDGLLRAVLDARVLRPLETGASSVVGVVAGSWVHPWAPWSSPRATFDLVARTGGVARVVHRVTVHHHTVHVLGPHDPCRDAPVLTVAADAALLLEWLAGDFTLGNVLALGGSVDGSLWHLSMLDAVMLWRRAEAGVLHGPRREALARLLVSAPIAEFRDRLAAARGRPGEPCTWYDGT